ncbi:Ku protein [Streptomyces sp. NPDC055092]
MAAARVRAVWNGALTFGLVSLPVQLFTATDSHTIHFHQLQRGTSDPVRNKRVNERTGEEVPLDEIVGPLLAAPQPRTPVPRSGGRELDALYVVRRAEAEAEHFCRGRAGKRLESLPTARALRGTQSLRGPFSLEIKCASGSFPSFLLPLRGRSVRLRQLPVGPYP